MTHQQTQEGDLVACCATLLSASDSPGTLAAFNPCSVPVRAITTIQTDRGLAGLIKMLLGNSLLHICLKKNVDNASEVGIA